MLTAFSKPCVIGPLSLRSRWVMPPMTRNQCAESRFVPENVEYYRQRAANHVGLIISEGMVVDHPLSCGPGLDLPRLLPQNIASIRALTDAVHAAGGTIAAQLWHHGHRTPGIGISASETRDKERRIVGTEATEADLADVIASFGRGAAVAKASGFDAIELHGAHGYLLHGFMRRYAASGDSSSPAARFVRDVVSETRRAVGPGYPIIFRMSQWSVDDFNDIYMRNPKEVETAVTPLVEAGVDILHVSTSRFWKPAFDGDPRTLSAWVRQFSGRPVIAVGGMGKNIDGGPDRFGTYEHADRLLGEGAFDLLAVGTGLLRDPSWCDKARRQAFQDMEIPEDPKKK